MCENLSILVTGSKGFIGKNLLRKISETSFNIFEFNRNDSHETLTNLIKKTDIIIHLAGEVRPNSLDNDFKTSNVLLTKDILEIIDKNDLNIPIIMASSIHAKLLKNEYGKTKREAEILIENYHNDKNIDCSIYRLPHVFGEDCKPNYNSVISTWIYNSINNLEIKVFDKNIKMEYVYVQDLVKDILELIKSEKIYNKLYINPNFVYNTTLGEVVDMINEFKGNVDNKKYNLNNNGFKKKLFDTYLDYYRSLEDVK